MIIYFFWYDGFINVWLFKLDLQFKKLSIRNSSLPNEIDDFLKMILFYSDLFLTINLSLLVNENKNGSSLLLKL